MNKNSALVKTIGEKTINFVERCIDFDALNTAASANKFLAELYARRNEPYVPRAFSALLRPTSMMGMRESVLEIAKAIEGGRQIVIAADYDADGATACAIGVRGLRMMGAKVDFVVPNRFTDGYGLSASVIDRAMQLNPGLIITVDNGITAIEGIAYAHSKGVPVVVTDHHLAGDTLPDAQAIVNPNQPGCQFESKNLAGCGVMFYVLISLRRYFADKGDLRGNAKLQNLLDLLALGTVADVVRLDANNRILVDGGLNQIRSGRACEGLKAIFDVAGKDASTCSTMDLGFSIAPRINAAGRMDDAAVGIRCLIEDDPEIAHYLANELHATNQLRRDVQEGIQESIEDSLKAISVSEQFTIVIADESWHEGVVGIVAGRLKDRHNRPVIVMTKSEEGTLKGSGRSIASLHLRDALAAVDAKHPGVLVRFGGHAMAAGLAIKKEHLEVFKQAFEAQVRLMLQEDASLLNNTIEHDGALSGDKLTVEHAEMLQKEVWGQGFPRPNFLFSAKTVDHRILKEKHTKLTVEVDHKRTDVILFNQVIDKSPEVVISGSMDINVWNGRKSVQIMADHIFAA